MKEPSYRNSNRSPFVFKFQVPAKGAEPLFTQQSVFKIRMGRSCPHFKLGLNFAYQKYTYVISLTSRGELGGSCVAFRICWRLARALCVLIAPGTCLSQKDGGVGRLNICPRPGRVAGRWERDSDGQPHGPIAGPCLQCFSPNEGNLISATNGLQ